MTDDLPAVRITVDQLVAINIRRWRRAAGITQEELGRRLGWSSANVSAAERSADPARDPRRFDAQTLTDLSLAIGVPLVAFLVPPEGDGTAVRYTFSAPGGDRGMRDLMERVVMPDSGDTSPAREAYRRDMDAAADRYLGSHWTLSAGRMLAEPEGLRALRADRLRAYAEAMMARAADQVAEIADLADAIDPRKEQP